MKKNNLFDYATSELSQDAFLCWSINWFNCSSKPLKEYGKAMLDLLLGDNKEDSYEKIEIRRQYGKIDVLVLFKDKKNNPHALIIEDKTGTSEHSNQMLRYKEKLNELIKNDEELKEYLNPYIHLAYVKIGIIYDDEKITMNEIKATIVDLEELINLVSSYSKLNISEILSDFNDYIQRIKSHRDVKKDQIEKKYEYEKALLKDAYGQFYFLDQIFNNRKRKRISDKYKNNDKEDNPSVYINHIYSGTNNSGTPWTQYSFWGEEYPENSINRNEKEYHFLFWRIDFNTKKTASYDKDKYKEIPYLALRHYDENRTKDDKFSVERKRMVYNKFRKYADDEICQKYKGICEKIGVRENYKESDLIYIPIENLNGIKFEEIKKLIRKITGMFEEKFNDKHDLYEGIEKI